MDTLINNQDKSLCSFLHEIVTIESNISVATKNISFNAIFDTLKILSKGKSCRIIVDKFKSVQEEARLVYTDRESIIYHQLDTSFRIKKVASFIEDKVSIRNGDVNSSFIIVDNIVIFISPNDFIESTLGVIKDGNQYMMPILEDIAGQWKGIFDGMWSVSLDFKKQLSALYHNAAAYRTPDFVYKYTLDNLFFDKNMDDINEQRMGRSGFKSSKIWSMLFNFQKDAVLGAIDKIEKYNGCVIADSVGLGKTFEALAVIKYYELRNFRVLLLTPKKLRDNWVTYKLNDKRNILSNDKFNFDVINHTDLSRSGGMSGDLNLNTINWGNYDLVVIDESHNFRNNIPAKNHVSRYEKMMTDIIRSGVNTRVLLLSATPVNTKLSDLKNQLAFITAGDDQALRKEGIKSIDLTIVNAQRKFTNWLKHTDHNRETLIDSLPGDYFKMLELFTIARSRKHIEQYYNSADIGKFPTRLKPIAKQVSIDTEEELMGIRQINDQLERLNLKFYSPLYFVLDNKRDEYAHKYDTPTKTGSVFRQLDREESIITLMRVNLLKRLESSVHSFELTLQVLQKNVIYLLNKIKEIDVNEAIENVDYEQFDFEDTRFEDLIVGGKVKVLLQDLDLIKFREFLNSDAYVIEHLLQECAKITAQRDHKLQTLKSLIKDKIQSPINDNNKKVIVFSAFADTVKYLYEELSVTFKNEDGIYSALVIGGDSNKTNMPHCRLDLTSILTNFSPLSKNREAVFPNEQNQIDILFCTDCISEGQNLQDADYLVNYDIHWNPVRIIQRFGRIDRIGSQNDKIQLVNFFPDIDLDGYIDLIGRVKGRMQMVDISATGDDNIIAEKVEEAQDLDYRKKQLEKMKSEVMDMEDLDGGISISDLTLNDFKTEADRISKEERMAFSLLPKAQFSLVRADTENDYSGMLFCFKDKKATDMEEKITGNLIYPFYLCYVRSDGSIFIPSRFPKNVLDWYRRLAGGEMLIEESLLKDWKQQTKSGQYMTRYQDLLNVALAHIKGEEDAAQTMNIFSAGASVSGNTYTNENYELISYLIIQ